MITLEHVGKTFRPGAPPAVTDLSLHVDEGHVVALVGPSGCGKTTTLKMINRLIEPSNGRILVAGRDVRDAEPHELRRQIGYVIQQVGLFAHRTVADNVATVPRLLGWDKARISGRVSELLALVGLDASLTRRYPSELSGGQQQRVGVARALAADPPVLLMDEPFGAVDPIVRARLQDELVALQRRLRKTIVFVTHDIDEAIKLSDRIALLNVGGVLEQYAAPEELLARPANGFVEAFLGAERGLKRLSLHVVSDVPLQRGPMVEVGAPAEEAAKAMEVAGTDWVGVIEGDRLLGWLPAAQTAGGVDAEGARPFSVRVTPAQNLREALDAVVGSQTRVAVVVDGDGRYLGLLTVDSISERLPHDASSAPRAPEAGPGT